MSILSDDSLMPAKCSLNSSGAFYIVYYALFQPPPIPNPTPQPSDILTTLSCSLSLTKAMYFHASICATPSLFHPIKSYLRDKCPFLFDCFFKLKKLFLPLCLHSISIFMYGSNSFSFCLSLLVFTCLIHTVIPFMARMQPVFVTLALSDLNLRDI